MDRCKQRRNFMDEMYDIICKIENSKPEPEVCNVSCPPLGCPRGPCPGRCCSKGICDPCCMSKMPCSPPSLPPPRCCMPRCLNDYACSTTRLSSCGYSTVDINQGNLTIRKGGCSNLTPHDQSRFQQAFDLPPYNLISTVLPGCTVRSVLYWNT